MAITKKEIETLIKESIPDALIKIEDLRGDEDHYKATIISKSFLYLLLNVNKPLLIQLSYPRSRNN